ncbi:MAG: RNA polymerase sigma factor [Anaerolineaceae bacterium]|nr:RNA polymerase sigma factor [Anaerolineaceae bacterium]
MTSTITNENQKTESLRVNAINDPGAFETLYDEYFPRLYKYTFYRVGDANIADDLVAEIFERILTHLPAFDPAKAPLGAWIFGIARHTVIDYLRRERRQQIFSLGWFRKDQPSALEAEDTTFSDDEKEALHTALRQLSTRELDVLSLKFASTLTNRQIAPLLGLSESNVGVILYRALKKLREEMNRSEEK